MWTGVVKFSVEKIHITSLRWMLEWAGRGLGCGDCYPGGDVDELEVEDVGRGTGVFGVVRLQECFVWLWYLMLLGRWERGRGRGG